MEPGVGHGATLPQRQGPSSDCKIFVQSAHHAQLDNTDDSDVDPGFSVKRQRLPAEADAWVSDTLSGLSELTDSPIQQAAAWLLDVELIYQQLDGLLQGPAHPIIHLVAFNFSQI